MKIQSLRGKILRLIEENPSFSRSDLHKVAGYSIRWLQKNDTEWFNANVHEKVQHGVIKRKADRKDLDVRMVSKIESAVKAIKNQPGKPERISVASILRHLGIKGNIMHEQNSLRFPNSQNAIKKEVETLTEFKLRVIRWGIDEMKKESDITTFHKLTNRLKIRKHYYERPKIKAAIEAGVAEVNRTARNRH